MDKDKALESVNEIKKLMENSSKFISFSGIIAIMAGVYTLIGVFIYYQLDSSVNPTAINEAMMVIIAGFIFIASALTAFILSYYKSKKTGQKFFSSLTYRVFWNFGLPMLTGGILCVSFWESGYRELITSTTLIFYGISLFNASKYSYRSLSWLGYAFICLGLVDRFIPNHGILFWTIGFGGFHIIYGILFYLYKERSAK